MKRYLDDAYTTSFQAKILSCDALPSGHFALVLDQTYFYPESGGQPPDRGVIADAEVVDVRESGENGIIHEVTAAVEGKVECEVDWDVRFDHMQQHTGQHLLTRAFIEITGMPTISFHMGEETSTIDLQGKEADEETMDAVESLANAIIWENREVLIRNVAVSELEESSLRKSLPAGVTEARLVEIEDFDVVACCGTHVRRTGELGALKILKHERVKKNIRVHFRVGRRAFWDYQDKHDVVKALANQFTTSVDGILEKVEKLTTDAQNMRKALRMSKKKLAVFEKDHLIKAARIHGDKHFVVHLCKEGDEEYLNLLASECKNEPDSIVLLGSKEGHVVCAASPGLSIDLANIVVGAAREAGGNGGGKGGFARVDLPASIDVMEFLEKVYEHVKETV